MMLARENPKKMELSRLLRPAKYAETARLARLQPYDPDKSGHLRPRADGFPRHLDPAHQLPAQRSRDPGPLSNLVL